MMRLTSHVILPHGGEMWDFKFTRDGKPRYLQIADALENDILSGEIPPGHRLKSHRGLARLTGVTVSTATRAYAEAEHRGLIQTVTGKGTFVLAMPPAPVYDPGIGPAINLGLTMPLFMEKEPSIRPALQKIAQEEDVNMLVKCFAPAGYPRHREIAAGWIRRLGVDVTADSLLIAAGHPHGLHTIFYSIFARADKIAVGRLTNPGLIALASRAGLELKGVKMDADGMIPEELDALCLAEKIKGVYISTCINYMGGKPVSPERREALARVIALHNLILIEDGFYSAPESGKTSPIATLLPENSICLLSFSAIIYSALCVAFIHAPPRFRQRLIQTVAENMWTVPPLCVALACESMVNGTADRAVAQKQKEIARRAKILRDALADFDLTCSEQSLYAWIWLPDSWNSRDFEYMAEISGVRVLSAHRFAVPEESAPNCVRLAVAGPPDIPTLKNGLDILVGLLKREGDIATPIW